MLVFETTIHFFYPSALLDDFKAMSQMPLWSMAGVGYLQGQLFMVKYFVIFGGFCALSQLDQIQTPGPPRCISYIYRYSQMWKYVNSLTRKLPFNADWLLNHFHHLVVINYHFYNFWGLVGLQQMEKVS